MNSNLTGWKNLRNQIDFMKYLKEKLCIQTWEDWYSIKSESFHQYGGSTLLQYYNYSVPKLLKVVYPEYNWKIWRFVRTPKDLWNESEIRRQFLIDLGKQYQFNSLNDWLRLTKNNIIHLGGNGLLKLYSGSLSGILSNLFPNHPFKDEHFDQHQETHILELREKLKFIEPILNIKRWEDWYNVKEIDYQTKVGSLDLLNRFGSISNMVCQLLPEYPWKPFKFSELNRGFWQNIENQRLCINDFAQLLHIYDWPNDWNRVTSVQVSQHECSSFISYYYKNSLLETLKNIYLDIDWNQMKLVNYFSPNSRKSQKFLQSTLEELLLSSKERN